MELLECEHWIVVSDEGHSAKPRRHLTLQSAYDESVRLSRLNPGIHFSIYGSLGYSFTPKPVKTETIFRSCMSGSRFWKNLYDQINIERPSGKWTESGSNA